MCLGTVDKFKDTDFENKLMVGHTSATDDKALCQAVEHNLSLKAQLFGIFMSSDSAADLTPPLNFTAKTGCTFDSVYITSKI